MTQKVEITPVVAADLTELMDNIRKQDLDEIRATGVPLASGLSYTVVTADEALAGRVNGELVSLFGVGQLSVLNDTGVPWLLGTNAVQRYGRVVAVESRRYVRLWQTRYPIMRNYVDARNSVALRWLRWLGFGILPAVPYGPYKMPFHPFELRGK